MKLVHALRKTHQCECYFKSTSDSAVNLLQLVREQLPLNIIGIFF